MTADVLRQAAALMRERAQRCEVVTWETNEGWYVESELIPPVIASSDVAHVASWRPTVALAVAEWLDTEAQVIDIITATDPDYCVRDDDQALVVARAYLGDLG